MYIEREKATIKTEPADSSYEIESPYLLFHLFRLPFDYRQLNGIFSLNLFRMEVFFICIRIYEMTLLIAAGGS